jgi:hypothetical protein
MRKSRQKQRAIEDYMNLMHKTIIWGIPFLIYLLSIRNAYSITGADLYYGETQGVPIMGGPLDSTCNHFFNVRRGKNRTFDPKMVKAGDIIGVRDIKVFMEKLDPLITEPYIILTHGCALETISEEQLSYLASEKIIAWFGIHPHKNGHRKFIPVPVGIGQMGHKSFTRMPNLSDAEAYNEVNNFLKNLRENVQKTQLLHLNFDKASSDDRKKSMKLFTDWNFSAFTEKPLPFREYITEMANYKFTLSPRGQGPDCLRTWEALIIGTIPIVMRGQYGFWFTPGNPLMPRASQLDTLYEDLPILIIESWTQITKEFLDAKYIEIASKKYDIRKLYTEYWHAKIKNKRAEFLALQ